MSTDEDYYPPGASTCGSLRRSKRITRYDIRKQEAKIMRKMDEEATKKTFTTSTERNKSSSKSTEEKSKDKEDGSNPNNLFFSGAALTSDELRHLFVKYKTDGHFHLTSPHEPASCSHPSIKNGEKRVATKKKDSNAATATLNGQKTRTNDLDKMNVSSHMENPLSLTLSNPLPNASGSTLHISTSNGNYISSNCPNDYKSTNGRSMSRSFLSSGTYRLGNGIDLSSDKNCMPRISNLNDEISGLAWNSFQRANENMKNRNDAKPPGLYYSGNDLSIGYVNDSSSIQTACPTRENTGNSYRNASKSVQPRPNNFCGNFNEIVYPTSAFHGVPITPVNSMMQNQFPYENSLNNWSGTSLNVSDAFIDKNPSNDSANPQDSTNYGSSSILGYNPDLKSSRNYCPYGFAENETAVTFDNDHQSGNHSSSIGWNNIQAFSTPYPSGNELSYANSSYNCPVSSGATVSPLTVNDPTNFNDQTNFWSFNHSLNPELLMINDTEASSSILPDNFTDATVWPTAKTTITATATTAEKIGIARTESQDTDEMSLGLDELPDNRRGDFCTTVSSICSYDDDIGYEHYMDHDFINGNSGSAMETLNQGPNTAFLTKIKAEVRPLYDSSMNYSQMNNDSRLISNEALLVYDFDTKRELANSPDCVILENPTKA